MQLTTNERSTLMGITTLVSATTPHGETVVLPVVDLDGTTIELHASAAPPSLDGVLKSIKDFSAGLRDALAVIQPERTAVEFSVGFATQAGQIAAMFIDGKAEGSVTITMEWGKVEQTKT